MSVLFDPLEIQISQDSALEPEIRANGMELFMPQTAVSPALLLRYPWSGRRLFNPSHLRLAAQAMTLAEQAGTSFNSYERGVMEERRRIARDLHDDVGARLLTSMHKPDLPKTRESLRLAMHDLRLVISALSGDKRPIGDVLADLRHETIERVEAAGLRIVWPPMADDLTPLEYVTRKNMVSAVREIISNALRHSGASRIDVLVTRQDGDLQITISDDGIGLPPAVQSSGTAGMGLQSIRQRMTDTGGTLHLAEADSGARITLVFPIASKRD
jgi:signal transduction histidine kinase